MVHNQLKFVNREKGCQEIIMELVQNVDCSPLSQTTLVGSSQTYGVGKNPNLS
jgi:hypothetical protein